LEELERERLRRLAESQAAAAAAALLKQNEVRKIAMKEKEKLANQRMTRQKEQQSRIANIRAERTPKRAAVKIERRVARDIHTHHSTCHHSREHVDMTIRFLPEPTLEYSKNNSMTIQKDTIIRRMVMARNQIGWNDKQGMTRNYYLPSI
jgi:hypothetical protein